MVTIPCSYPAKLLIDRIFVLLYYNNMAFTTIPSVLHRLPDRLGLLASIGCGLHCAAMSAMLMLYPTLWLNRSLWESGLWQNLILLELWFLVLAWVFAVIAMSAALLRRRNFGPPLLAVPGLVLLTAAIATPLHNQPLVGSLIALSGGLILAAAHGWNLIHLRRCRLATPQLKTNQS